MVNVTACEPNLKGNRRDWGVYVFFRPLFRPLTPYGELPYLRGAFQNEGNDAINLDTHSEWLPLTPSIFIPNFTEHSIFESSPKVGELARVARLRGLKK